MSKQLLSGILHEVTEEIVAVLQENKERIIKWNKLTPVQRNEWICWITIARKEDTRIRRIKRMAEALDKGQRTPCCWPGCPHRKPSVKRWHNYKE